MLYHMKSSKNGFLSISYCFNMGFEFPKVRVLDIGLLFVRARGCLAIGI